jgi:hypothetical protein
MTRTGSFHYTILHRATTYDSDDLVTYDNTIVNLFFIASGGILGTHIKLT